MVGLPFDATRIRLAALAVSDALLTAVSSSQWTNLFDWLASSTAVAIVTGILAGTTSEIRILSQVTGVVFTAYLAYELVPRLFSNTFGQWLEQRPGRLLATALVVGLVKTPSGNSTTGIIVLIVLGTAGFVAYFVGMQDDPLAGPDGYAHQVGKGIKDIHPGASSDEGDELDIESDTIRSRANRWLLVTLFAAVMVVMCALLALILLVLGLFFPLLELSVLGWTVLAGLIDMNGSNRLLSVEESFYNLLSIAFHQPLKGFPTLLLVVLGLFASAMPYLLGFGVIAILSVNNVVYLLSTARGLVTSFILVALVVAGAYGIWFWFRITKRLTGFLSERTEESTSELPVSRPIFGILPGLLPLAVLAVAFPLIGFVSHQTQSQDLIPFRITVALGAVVAVSIVVPALVAYRTRSRGEVLRSTQSVRRDNRVIPVSFVTQYGVTAGLLYGIAMYAPIKQQGLSGLTAVDRSLPFVNRELGLIVILIAGLFYFDEFQSWVAGLEPRTGALMRLLTGTALSGFVLLLLRVQGGLTPLDIGVSLLFLLLSAWLAWLSLR
ncbi:hypothetical protein [Haloplanus sp. C73]|uniref:hypothetical protein n=1 Tax=Haloplanus sp. C73 TaxID=3421641 RepID=UPI003EBCF821